MAASLYEVLALGLRYWFAVLGVLIVLRSFLWLRRDRRGQKRRLRRLPDAGTVGELVVLRGSDELPEGAVIALPWEGVLGYNRMCDVVVPASGVAARHLDFSFEERLGLLVTPRGRNTCQVDGTLLTGRSRARKHPMLHGSTLEVGEALLKLRVFAGIDVEHHVPFAEVSQPPQDQAAPYAPIPGQVLPGYQQPWPAQTSWQQPVQMEQPGNGDAMSPQAAWMPYGTGYGQPQSAMPPAYGQTTPDYGQAGYPPPDVTGQPQPEPGETEEEPVPRPRHRRAGRRDADG